jgi:hypothetical protein
VPDVYSASSRKATKAATSSQAECSQRRRRENQGRDRRRRGRRGRRRHRSECKRYRRSWPVRDDAAAWPSRGQAPESRVAMRPQTLSPYMAGKGSASQTRAPRARAHDHEQGAGLAVERFVPARMGGTGTPQNDERARVPYSAGESHGPALVAIMNGLPAGLVLDQDHRRDVRRRQVRPGSWPTPTLSRQFPEGLAAA